MTQPRRPHHATNCPHCHAHGTVHAPSSLWRIGLGLAWLAVVAQVAFIGLVGPFILVLGPIVALSGAGLLAFLHGKVGEPATCRACGKIVEVATAATVHRRAPVMPAAHTA